MNDNHRSRLDVVDIALNSIRGVPIPDGPSPKLVASTLEALSMSTPPPEDVRLHKRNARMFRIARYGGLTAAAMAIALLFGWMFFNGASGNVAFGDVIKKVKEAESVRLVLKQTVEKDLEVAAQWSIRGHQLRMEYLGQQILLVDLKAKQTLQLDLVNKVATKSTLAENAAEKKLNIIYQLSHLQPEKAKHLEDEMVDGRTALVYEFDNLEGINFMGLEDSTGRMKLWIDPESKLPLRIVVDLVSSGEKINTDSPFDTTLTLEKFEWNKQLDDSLFSMEIPKDYTVQDAPARAKP